MEEIRRFPKEFTCPCCFSKRKIGYRGSAMAAYGRMHKNHSLTQYNCKICFENCGLIGGCNKLKGTTLYTGRKVKK